MQVGGDDFRFGLVKLFEIGDDAAECGKDCSVSKSPMCWLTKTWSPTESATAFFKCAPTARMTFPNSGLGFRI